jgi:hypothetical protein
VSHRREKEHGTELTRSHSGKKKADRDAKLQDPHGEVVYGRYGDTQYMEICKECK